MKIVNESTLDRFRGPGRCEWCAKLVRNRHPDHVHTRGAGRLDIPCNLWSLCETFAGGDNCHDAKHAGHITRSDALAVVGVREGLNQDDIVAIVHRLRRAPKECRLCPRCEGTGKYRRLPGTLWYACALCDGSGCLTGLGEPWKEAS